MGWGLTAQSGASHARERSGALVRSVYGMGVFAAGEIVDLASEAGLPEKSGAYYAMGGQVDIVRDYRTP